MYCDYTTKDSGNFCHHKKTKKHIKNKRNKNRIKKQQLIPIKISEKSYTCDLCNLTFINKHNLKRHLMNICPHLNKKVRIVKDKVCRQNTKNKPNNILVKNDQEKTDRQDKDIPGGNPSDSEEIYLESEGRKKYKVNVLNVMANLELPVLDTLREFDMLDQYIDGKQCPFCDKMFNRKDNFKRHCDNCTKKDVFMERYKTQKAEQKTQKAEKIAETYKDSADKMATALVSNANKKSLSKMTQITNNYPNAEPLKLLSYDDYMDHVDMTHIPMRPHMDDEQQFVEAILSAHRNGGAEGFLSEALIDLYKTDDPNNQSVWCTDTSRLRYVVMMETGENQQWTGDKGGVITRKTIIDPLIKKVKELLIKYDSHYYVREYTKWLKLKYPKNKSKHTPDMLYMERYIRYQYNANKLLNEIKNNKLQKKMLVYMANHFSFGITGVIEDKK